MDGRSARAQRTRDAIVDACISLVEEGELRPTAPTVAERAQVSVRSVFQHFDDLPSLHTAVIARVTERMSSLLVPVPSGLPLEDRVTAIVSHRATLFEAATPYRRAANVHGPFAPEIRRSVRDANRYLRHDVERTFAPELAGRAAADREELLLGLATVLSWAAWDALRSEEGCDVGQAQAVVARTVWALLG